MRLPLLLVLLAASAGCGGPRSARHLEAELVAPAPAWTGVVRVAVMPPDNWTHDLGLEYVTWYRAVIHEILAAKGYEPVPIAAVNRFLLRNRFTVSGEAAMYGPAELARELGADAVLHWNITTTSPTLAFVLVKADGIALWSSGDASFRREYRMHPRAPGADQVMAVTLSEILRKLPVRP